MGWTHAKLSSEVGYIHEPFDPTDHAGSCTGTFSRWYEQVKQPAPEVRRCVEDALAFKYNPWPRLRTAGARGHSPLRDVVGVGYTLICQSGVELSNPGLTA